MATKLLRENFGKLWKGCERSYKGTWIHYKKATKRAMKGLWNIMKGSKCTLYILEALEENLYLVQYNKTLGRVDSNEYNSSLVDCLIKAFINYNAQW